MTIQVDENLITSIQESQDGEFINILQYYEGDDHKDDICITRELALEIAYDLINRLENK